MNDRGFALAAGFLFLAVTVLFIVNIHVAQLEYQSASMSRSTLMDNLHYQKIDRVQAFRDIGEVVVRSFPDTTYKEGADEDTEGLEKRYIRALGSWKMEGVTYHEADGTLISANQFTGIEPSIGNDEVIFRLEGGEYIEFELDDVGKGETFRIGKGYTAKVLRK